MEKRVLPSSKQKGKRARCFDGEKVKHRVMHSQRVMKLAGGVGGQERRGKFP